MDQPTTGAAAMRARYTGRARDLFPLFLGTLLLTVVTLGVYRFWARARIRKHIWSRVALQDDALEYTGTGKELFLGFLKAALVLVPVIALVPLMDVLAAANPDFALAFSAMKAVVYLVFGYLFYVGYYAATRYRLSRTRWRGIRFALAGSPWHYGAMAMLGMVLRFVTLGLYTPYYDVKLAGYEAKNRRFGTKPFLFQGSGRDLLGSYAMCWLLFIPTLGLSWFWYDARRMCYVVAHTGLDKAQLSLGNITGWKVMALKMGNFFIALFTLGFCYPVVVRRTMRFWCDNLSAMGSVDFARIGQAAARAGSGEGLAGFFDIDAVGG